jgi:hypothetical protein
MTADTLPDVVVDPDLRAPFPWFGGKRKIAPLVWSRFGDVASYNEPFAGSLAVLLGRPHPPRIETVNDRDCYLANFWRALQHAPDAVAYWADSPVNEADLHARHRWLVTRGRRRALRCMVDPHYFDAKVAGWWVWGQCLWIGSGWCQTVATERRTEQSAKRPKLRERGDDGVPVRRRHENGADADRVVEWRARPDLSSANGRGALMSVQRSARTRSRENPSEQRKRPHLVDSNGGKGVHRRWQGGGQGGGSGVHAPRLQQKKPALSQGGNNRSGHGRGVLADHVKTAGLYDYMYGLAARLRRTRVCCGDWKRVLTPSVTTYIGITGVLLDPPYAHDLRERCYAEDHDISADVRAWALAHGDDPKFRIALCGYEDEHKEHMPPSWSMVPWKAHGGYSRTERGKANRERERVWFSPHCLEPSLFDEDVEVFL